MEQDEYLDLVDENDAVIGRKLRSEVHAEGLHNYRSINLFIVNSRGELWIPRRTASKTLFPLGLDFGCAGHVQSGDSYEETLRKEAKEELNIDIDEFSIRGLGKMTPAEGFPCYSMNYEMSSDTAPDYNRDDYCEAFWLTPEALIARINAGDYSKSGLPKAVKKFYLSKNAA